MSDVRAVSVPGGFAVDGVRRRRLRLRALTGEDELYLLEEAAGLSPAARTTALLERALVEAEPGEPPPDPRSLAVGDREALLLELRRATLGPRMQCLLSCPTCGDKVDVDLDVDSLILPAYGSWAVRHEATIGRRRVTFRLPTGADQEAAATLALDDPAAAARLVLERCLGEPPDEATERAVPPLLAELDPQADVVLEVACPVCGASFAVEFDTGDYLCRELLARPVELFREVHALASRYGWAEDEILRLPHGRRRLYLELVAEGATA